jgi:hypothetical protein
VTEQGPDELESATEGQKDDLTDSPLEPAEDDSYSPKNAQPDPMAKGASTGDE